MKKTNDGRRKQRVEKEVQQVVSEFIIHHLREDIPGVVTVTRIHMPADFRAAQVYITHYDPTNAGVDAVKVLQGWTKDIQDEISHQLKMRYCPKITFHEDEATEHILKIEKILSNLSPEGKLNSTYKDQDELDPDEETD